MIKAVIFDVYETLLEVREPALPPADSWTALCLNHAGSLPCPLEEFEARTLHLVEAEHRQRRIAGEPHPEVDWKQITRSALPEMTLGEDEWDAFIQGWARARRRCVLSAIAEKMLGEFSGGYSLGICSNAQAYTKVELSEALHAAGWSGLEIFHHDLQFWSWEQGFAKPSPKAFQFLNANLRNLGILPNETLMIGDREDNDISPARAAGWQTRLVRACV